MPNMDFLVGGPPLVNPWLPFLLPFRGWTFLHGNFEEGIHSFGRRNEYVQCSGF